MIDFVQAIRSLKPTASFAAGETINTIEWLSPDIAQPSVSEIEAEMSRLQAEYDAQAYARSRSSEYPPITDYLDGVVKNDQAQIDAYVAACQAVKAKYPKV